MPARVGWHPHFPCRQPKSIETPRTRPAPPFAHLLSPCRRDSRICSGRGARGQRRAAGRNGVQHTAGPAGARGVQRVPGERAGVACHQLHLRASRGRLNWSGTAAFPSRSFRERRWPSCREGMHGHPCVRLAVSKLFVRSSRDARPVAYCGQSGGGDCSVILGRLTGPVELRNVNTSARCQTARWFDRLCLRGAASSPGAFSMCTSWHHPQ